MANLNNLRIHHIGYAVKDIDKAIALFQKIGYLNYSKSTDDIRNVSIVFMKNGGYFIELISPLNREFQSPVDTILKKNGPTPYHICYETDNIVETVAFLISEHFHVISEINPAPAINGKNVVFLHNTVIGVIELVDI